MLIFWRTKDRPICDWPSQRKRSLDHFCHPDHYQFWALVLLTDSTTVFTGLFLAVGLAALYPFTKRYTYYPQVALGAAYSCSIFTRL